MGNQPAAQQAKRTLYPHKFVEEITHKIRNVAKNIFDVMEKAGGHTLKKHVAKNNNYLKSRTFKSKVNAATTFKDKKTATKAVKENLRNNADKIAQWLVEDLEEQIVLEHTHQYPIGEGLYKRKHATYHDLVASKIVIIRDINQELGFTILTAFPTIK